MNSPPKADFWAVSLAASVTTEIGCGRLYAATRSVPADPGLAPSTRYTPDSSATGPWIGAPPNPRICGLLSSAENSVIPVYR